MHSEEEIAGSYNWDYLLDWGPQYQPLAHVFHEISALKDESGGGVVVGVDTRVPPIITCRPPRHVHAPPGSAASSRTPGSSGHTGGALRHSVEVVMQNRECGDSRKIDV